MKGSSLLALLLLLLAVACEETDDGGGGRSGAGMAGESTRGGSSNTGGASGEAGASVAGGGTGATDSGGTSGAGGASDTGGAGAGGEGGDAGGSVGCEYFAQAETYPNIKALLKFQTTGATVDFSPESIKTAYASWSASGPAIPNRADFQSELCTALEWLDSADRFANLAQATTALSPNGGPAETGLELLGLPYYFVPLDEGWRLYARWVAHNVALEMRGALPWSLERLAETNPDAALALLDSTEMMHRRPQGDIQLGHENYHYTAQPFSSSLGLTIIGMPRYTFRFLAQNGLVKATERETVVALLEWSRNNLAHFVGPSNRESCQANWGHPYPPTVEMVIEGTTSTAALPTTIPRFQHWTMGCSGTSQFLKDVLRAVNIPARVPNMCGHTQAWFPGLDLWLDHGDNPYDRNFSETTCGADFLLLDRATWQMGFGTTLGTVYQGGVCDAVPSPIARRTLPESVATCPMQ